MKQQQLLQRHCFSFLAHALLLLLSMTLLAVLLNVAFFTGGNECTYIPFFLDLIQNSRRS
jgi:hypothetical protein